MANTTRRYLLALSLAAVVAMAACGANGGDDRAETAKPRAPSLDELRSLPYANVVKETPERKALVGVQRHDRERAWQGLNLYCNHFDKTTGVYLVDMNGDVVHQWSLGDSSLWKLAVLDDDGSVVGAVSRGGQTRLVKLDWNSRLVFSRDGEYHHDLHFLDDGRMVTLRRNDETQSAGRFRFRHTNSYLVRLSPGGEPLDEVSLYHLVRGDIVMTATLEAAVRGPAGGDLLDLLHANTAAPLNVSINGFCEPGDVLVCVRNLDLIFVYNFDERRVRWKHYGSQIWQHPHEPTLLENGRVLLFDNGYKRGYSRVIEFDPFSMRIEWQYQGDPPKSFFTEVRGSIQRLPNGNTLITESDTGRVFEVTTGGDIVWEWLNPLFSAENERATVYRMKRVDRSILERHQ